MTERPYQGVVRVRKGHLNDSARSRGSDDSRDLRDDTRRLSRLSPPTHNSQSDLGPTMSPAEDSPGASAAALACLSDEVVSRIAVFVRLIYASDPDLGCLQSIEATYKPLSQLSLVAPTFRKAAQRGLDQFLLFRIGAQVKNWLDYAGERGPRNPTRQLTVFDTLPFREGDSPSCKWSYADLQSLFDTVVGVEAISILFFGQISLPVDLLTGPQLSGESETQDRVAAARSLVCSRRSCAQASSRSSSRVRSPANPADRCPPS